MKKFEEGSNTPKSHTRNRRRSAWCSNPPSLFYYITFSLQKNKQRNPKRTVRSIQRKKIDSPHFPWKSLKEFCVPLASSPHVMKPASAAWLAHPALSEGNPRALGAPDSSRLLLLTPQNYQQHPFPLSKVSPRNGSITRPGHRRPALRFPHAGLSDPREAQHLPSSLPA